MDICAIDTRSFDTVKSNANVAAIFFFGFGAGFVVCLLSVYSILPSLSGETCTTARDTFAGNHTASEFNVPIPDFGDRSYAMTAFHPASNDPESAFIEDKVSRSAKGASEDGQVACHDWLAPKVLQPEDPWISMKAVTRPAPCTVKGFAIDELDPENNFRRAWALGLVNHVEDKTTVLPYMLAAHDVTLSTRTRRVYLDLGGNTFGTSVTWFSRNYPLDFTEYHVFEKVYGLFNIPSHHPPQEEKMRGIDKKSRRATKGAPIPNHILDRITLYRKYATTEDKKHRVNTTRFIKEELGMRPDDVLIVKMDIEGAEWDVLQAWLEDPEMATLVDELFVEIHYAHPSMSGYSWNKFKHSREEAVNLLVNLRKAGFYVHPWP